jgi:dihydropteroate synthase
VLRDLGRLQELRCPVLLAVSRKDFIGAITETRPMDRLPGTLAAISAGLERGAAVLRVHDVAATRAYLTVRAALGGVGVIDEELRLPMKLRRQDPLQPAGRNPLRKDPANR